MADEETDVISPEREMTAAEVLEEQKRLENEALRLALPRQEAEAAALQADYQRGIGSGILVRPTTPVEYAQGTVMPTSGGFMYVGNSLPPPEAGTPLAVQRAYESAVMRQNAPEAATAAAAVEAAGLPRPTGLSLPRPATYPTPDTTAGMRYAPQQVLMDMIATGKIQGDEAKSLLQGLSMRAGNQAMLGMTPAQQKHYALVAERLAFDKEKQAKIDAAKSTPTETVIETIPATAGSPELPARSGIFGIGARPYTPAVPAAGEKKVTRKVLVTPPASKGKLNKGQAASFLKQAGGDKEKARRMAVEAGYEL